MKTSKTTFLIIVSLTVLSLLSSCRTNSIIDSVFYSTSTELTEVAPETWVAVCEAIETNNLFDLLVYHVDVIVSYPQGDTNIFRTGNTISLTYVDRVDRTFNTNEIGNEEGLYRTAHNYCKDVKNAVVPILGHQVDVSLRLYDPISGTTVNYSTANFSGNCDDLFQGSIGFGSYAEVPESGFSCEATS